MASSRDRISLLKGEHELISLALPFPIVKTLIHGLSSHLWMEESFVPKKENPWKVPEVRYCGHWVKKSPFCVRFLSNLTLGGQKWCVWRLFGKLANTQSLVGKPGLFKVDAYALHRNHQLIIIPDVLAFCVICRQTLGKAKLRKWSVIWIKSVSFIAELEWRSIHGCKSARERHWVECVCQSIPGQRLSFSPGWESFVQQGSWHLFLMVNLLNPQENEHN